jgi:hypothetical protein
VAVIEPGNFIAGTSLYNADVVKAQSKRMWEGMVRIFVKDFGFVFLIYSCGNLCGNM